MIRSGKTATFRNLVPCPSALHLLWDPKSSECVCARPSSSGVLYLIEIGSLTKPEDYHFSAWPATGAFCLCSVPPGPTAEDTGPAAIRVFIEGLEI